MSTVPQILTDALERLPQPLFDPRPLWECVEVMEVDRAIATITELISLYLTDSLGYRERILEAIAQKDDDALRRAAHTLKSSSRSLGAAALGELCESLEEHAIAKRFTLASLQKRRFEKNFDDSLTILKQLQQDLSASIP